MTKKEFMAECGITTNILPDPDAPSTCEFEEQVCRIREQFCGLLPDPPYELEHFTYEASFYKRTDSLRIGDLVAVCPEHYKLGVIVNVFMNQYGIRSATVQFANGIQGLYYCYTLTPIPDPDDLPALASHSKLLRDQTNEA